MKHLLLILSLLCIVGLWGCTPPESTDTPEPSDTTDPPIDPVVDPAPEADPVVDPAPEVDPVVDPAPEEVAAALEGIAKYDGAIVTRDPETNAVVGVDLLTRQSQITPEDLELISKLTDLKELKIYGPGVTDESVKHLLTLVNLTSYASENADITGAGLETLCQLQSISKLAIRRSGQLVDADMIHLKNLPNLRYLTLLYNSLGDPAMEIISTIPNMRLLDIRGCLNVGDAGVTNIATMDTLVALKLRNAMVTDAGLGELKALTSLTSLAIEDAFSVSDYGLAALKEMPQITELTLVRSYGVSDMGLENLAGLTGLKKLSLRDISSLNGSGLVHIAGATELYQLDLSETYVNDEGLAHIKGLTKLTYLNLWHTQVTDAGLADTVANFSELKFLGLRGINNISNEGVLTVIASLPKIEEIHIGDNYQLTDELLEGLKDVETLRKITMFATGISDDAVEAFQETRPDVEVSLNLE